MFGRIEIFHLGPDPDIPNNPVLPVVIYRGALMDEKDAAAVFEQRFMENGWGGCWRNGIYNYHHFHSNAHEVLGIARGYVMVQLGGATGRICRLEAGDFVVLPA